MEFWNKNELTHICVRQRQIDVVLIGRVIIFLQIILTSRYYNDAVAS